MDEDIVINKGGEGFAQSRTSFWRKPGSIASPLPQKSCAQPGAELRATKALAHSKERAETDQTEESDPAHQAAQLVPLAISPIGAAGSAELLSGNYRALGRQYGLLHFESRNFCSSLKGVTNG